MDAAPKLKNDPFVPGNNYRLPEMARIGILEIVNDGSLNGEAEIKVAREKSGRMYSLEPDTSIWLSLSWARGTFRIVTSHSGMKVYLRGYTVI